MKLFKSSLKHRLYFSLTVLLLTLAILFYAVVYLGGDAFMWFPLVLLVTFLLALLLINYVYHPFSLLIESIETGLNCLRDNDFSINLAEQNYSEFKESIDTYNQLARILRKERMELHQRELLLDTVIQSTPMAIILTTESGVIVYSNLSARKLLNHPHRLESHKFDGLVNQLPEELKYATKNRIEGLYNVQIEDEKKVFYLTCQEFNLNAQTHYLYLYKNMTSEVTKEELLIWKKVIRLISHELNNSLAPIQSLTHSASKIIKKQPGNEMLIDILETIDRRSQHLHLFIEKYAKFSRLPTPQIFEVDLGKFVNGLQKICEVAIEIHGLVEEAVRFDHTQMEQVVINLIKNAKESEGDESLIEVTISITHKAIKISVKDRGKGMTEEQLKHSLLPFFTTKNDGSGLGLALSNEIISAHNGRLKIYNRDGGGLAVEFELPND